MNEKEKKEALQRVPTRKLLASIKRDLRKQLNASRSVAKPKKK
jgi:predicted component of type VI protein secretion system